MEVNQRSPVRGALGKSKSKVTKLTEDNTALRGAYNRLFTSRDGKVVLADLLTRFYDCEISESDTARDVGKRDVLRFIKRTMTP